MKRQKLKPSKRMLTQKNILTSLIIVSLWWAFWLGSQGLFIVDVPILSDWLIASDPQTNFISLTIWIIVVNLIALAIYHWLQRDYSFLNIRDKWDVVAYTIPLGLIIVLLITKASVFGVPILIYISAMVVTNFCQELLTTGFMQTGLSKRIGNISAAFITCVVFYLGHFMILETFTPIGIIMVAGFILFSWLRLKRGNIYLTNVVHLSWSLIMVLSF